MDGGGEPLVPPLAEQELVGRRQELRRRQGPEQPAERSGEQERAGARVDALARDVDEDEREGVPLVVVVRHDEVPREGRPAGRAGRHVDVPLGRERRDPSLPVDPRLQVDQHRVAQVAGHAEPGSTTCQRDHHGAHQDHGHDPDPPASRRGLVREPRLQPGLGEQHEEEAGDERRDPARRKQAVGEQQGHQEGHRGEQTGFDSDEDRDEDGEREQRDELPPGVLVHPPPGADPAATRVRPRGRARRHGTRSCGGRHVSTLAGVGTTVWMNRRITERPASGTPAGTGDTRRSSVRPAPLS